LFVNARKNNLRLQSSSPCLNAGIDKQDYDGDGDTTERINIGVYITGNEIIGVVGDKIPLRGPKNVRMME
jgi:hypothetical protein